MTIEQIKHKLPKIDPRQIYGEQYGESEELALSPAARWILESNLEIIIIRDDDDSEDQIFIREVPPLESRQRKGLVNASQL